MAPGDIYTEEEIGSKLVPVGGSGTPQPAATPSQSSTQGRPAISLPSSALSRILFGPVSTASSLLYDVAPDFRGENEISPVDFKTRLAVKGFLDEDPDRAIKYLQERGQNATLANDGRTVLVDGKPVDPNALSTTFKSITELVSEAAENWDFIPGLVGKSPLTAGTVGLATGTAKEAVASQISDTPFRPTNVLDETIGGVFGGGVEKYGLVKAIPKAAAGTYGLAKKGVQKLIGKAKPITDELLQEGIKVADQGYTFVKGTKLFGDVKKQLVDMFSSNRALARELGARPQDLNRLQSETLEDHLGYLLENSPEFVDRIVNQPFVRLKADNAIDMYRGLQKAIADGYESSTAVVNVDDILNSKGFSKLLDLATETTQVPKVLSSVQANQRQVLETLYNTIYLNKALSPGELYNTAARMGIDPEDIVADPKNAQQIIDSILDLTDEYDIPLEDAAAKLGLFPPANELQLGELVNAVRGQQLPINEAFAVRRNLDKLSRWGSDNKDFDASVAAIRNGANAFREAIRSALEKEGNTELLTASDSFHHLMPIVETIIRSDAIKGGIIPTISQLFAGAINSPARRAAVMAQRAASSPTTRGILRQGYDVVRNSIDGVQLPPLQRGAAAETMSSAGKALDYIRGMTGYDLTQNAIDDSRIPYNIPNPARPMAPQQLPPSEDILAGASRFAGEPTPTPTPGPIPQVPPELLNNIPMPQPKPITRDPEMIGKNPQDLELLRMAVSPNTFLMFQDAMGSNDPLKKRIATVQAMKEAPEIFEPSMYGLRSLISEGDRFVIGDPAEAVMYRQTIKHLKGVGKIGENFYTMQLSALNDPTDMTVYPRPDIITQGDANALANPDNNIAKLEELSNRFNTSTVSGERRSYDY